MNADLGGTLRKQRDELALSHQQVSALAGVPSDRVAAIEAGAGASTAEISKLAKALAVDPAALWRGEISSARTTARFRTPSGIASLPREDATLLARGAEVGRITAHLLSILERPPSPVAAARRILPVEPLLHVSAHPDIWARALAHLRNRAS